MQFQPSPYSFYGAEAGQVTFTDKSGRTVTVRSQEDLQRILAAQEAAKAAQEKADSVSDEDKKKAAAALTMGLGMVALSIAGTFVLWPMVIKEFKPEWSYSQRLMGGFFASAVLNALYRVGRTEEKD